MPRDLTSRFDVSTRGAPSILLLVVVLAAGCAGPPGTSGIVRGPPGAYPAAFPASDMSGQLSLALDAVKQLQVSVTYDVHSFSEADAPTELDLEREDVLAGAASVTTISETRRATAVVVSRSPRGILLLTAAHAVFRPDTIVEYFGVAPRGVRAPDRRVRSVLIKNNQTNWALGLPGLRTFDVLAWDADRDVALIGFPIIESDDLDRAWPIRVLGGDPADVAPGSFVYILGYPGGYRMVSRGVATPLDDGTDAFVIDGNWNQGVSGGAVLAVREDGGALEWVGMARAAAAVREQQLVPPDDALDQHDPAVPYDGPIFLQETLRIQYGVTLSVPMTTIRRFIEDHRASLSRQGYQVPRL